MVEVAVVLGGSIWFAFAALHIYVPETMLYIREWPGIERENVEMTEAGKQMWRVLGLINAVVGAFVIMYGVVIA